MKYEVKVFENDVLNVKASREFTALSDAETYAREVFGTSVIEKVARRLEAYSDLKVEISRSDGREEAIIILGYGAWRMNRTLPSERN